MFKRNVSKWLVLILLLAVSAFVLAACVPAATPTPPPTPRPAPTDVPPTEAPEEEPTAEPVAEMPTFKGETCNADLTGVHENTSSSARNGRVDVCIVEHDDG